MEKIQIWREEWLGELNYCGEKAAGGKGRHSTKLHFCDQCTTLPTHDQDPFADATLSRCVIEAVYLFIEQYVGLSVCCFCLCDAAISSSRDGLGYSSILLFCRIPLLYRVL